MEMKEYIEQLNMQIEAMTLKKEKYLSKRLYALILPVLIFLLGKFFTTINVTYLAGISLGYGVITSVYNFIRYQYYRGIILADTMKKLEIDMLDNANDLHEYFNNVKQKQASIKESIIECSNTLNLELKILLLCLSIGIINMSSSLIFFRMFGIAFAFGCLNDYLSVMNCLREKLKLTDEESVIGVFLKENEGIEEISNILSEVIAIEDNQEKVNLDDYCLRIMKVDDDYNITDMQVEDTKLKKDNNSTLAGNVKVRKLTKDDKNNNYRKK